MDQNNKRILAVVGLIVIVMVIAIGAIATKSDDNQQTTSNSSSTTSSQPTTSSSDSSSSFKDGSYEATGSYSNPGGTSSVDVKLTIKDNIVTESTFTPEAENSESREYQEQFASGYKSQVVGKKLSDIVLSRVSGSSLTSQGFNEALEQIKSQAQA